MRTLRNEHTFFVRCSVHHAMNVASKSMGSRDAQIEDIHVSPILKPVIARIPGAAAAVHPSAAPHIFIFASGSVPPPEVDLPYADCPASIVFALASREYDCVLPAVLPAFIIEKTYQVAAGKPVIFTVPRCGDPCEVAFPRALFCTGSRCSLPICRSPWLSPSR